MNSSGADSLFHPATADRSESRAIRVRLILDEVMARFAAGEAVDTHAIARQHGELMPELADQLGTLERIRDACAAASGMSTLGEFDPGPEFVERFEDALLRTALADYDVLERLHQGGQGVVYKSRQKSTGELVALKLLLNGPLASARQRRRFEREIEIASRLRHPNVVRILTSGVAHGRPYFTMEFVEGERLDDYALLNAPTVRQRLETFLCICDGVSYAHQQGVIHRDLKPSNILITKEAVEARKKEEADPRPQAWQNDYSAIRNPQSAIPKILDFGLAKEVSPEGDDTTISRTGQVLGTLQYLSPEQAAGRDEDVDVRSDVYALGVVLHQLLSGAFPYDVAGPPATVRRSIQTTEPAPLRRAVPDGEWPQGVSPADIAADLEAVLLKALEKERDRRYQSVHALAEDLRRYLAGEAVAARSNRSLYILGKILARHRAAAAVGCVALLVIGALGGQLFRLAEENEAVAATRDLRTDQGIDTSRGLLRRLELARSQAQRGAELAELPPSLHSAHLARYSAPPQELHGWTGRVREMPEDIVEAALSDESTRRSAAESWLQGANPFLDQLADLLIEQSFQMPATPPPAQGETVADNSWVGTRVCGAFVARAYQNDLAGDTDAALANLSAANRLALDIGDGLKFIQRDASLGCRRLIYRFLLNSMSRAIREQRALGAYVDWIEADPIVQPLAPAWEPIRPTALAAVQSWFVAEAGGGEERFDPALFEQFVRAQWPALGSIDSSAFRHLRREDMASALEGYIAWTQGWDDASFESLTQQTDEYDQRIVQEKPQQPILYYLPTNIRGAYVVRLRVWALRGAVRLIGHAAQFQELHGRWPSRLEDAVPPQYREDLIDPIAGRPFEYDLELGIPRLQSAWLIDRYVREDYRGPWRSEQDDKATYFPAPPPTR